MKKMEDLFKAMEGIERAKLAVPAAADDAVIKACAHAYEKGIITPIFVGDKAKIEKIMEEENIKLAEYEIIDEPDNKKAVSKAVELVRDGKAKILMKGLVGTADFLRGVLNKEKGLPIKGLLSHVSVFEIPDYDRFLLITDVAMNIAPNLDEKIKIINNAVKVAHALGVETPKVALLNAAETVSPKLESSVDAAIISKMNDRKQIKGCIIDGPLALDNAISEKSAKHKGIVSPVAGKADILMVPHINGGNFLYKSLVYFSPAKFAGVIVGTSVPIVLTSRSDSDEAKFNSIMLAAYLSKNMKS
jgi:phosphate butyryltransferase